MYPGSASITLLLIICQKYISPHSLEHPHRSGKWNSTLTLSVHQLFVWRTLWKRHKIWTLQAAALPRLGGASSGQAQDAAAPLNVGKGE